MNESAFASVVVTTQYQGRRIAPCWLTAHIVLIDPERASCGGVGMSAGAAGGGPGLDPPELTPEEVEANRETQMDELGALEEIVESKRFAYSPANELRTGKWVPAVPVTGVRRGTRTRETVLRVVSRLFELQNGDMSMCLPTNAHPPLHGVICEVSARRP